MNKKLFLVSVLLISLAVSCKATGGKKVPKPRSASLKATQLQVTGNRDVFLTETQLLSLSPDGKWLLGLTQDSICIYETATMAEKTCASWKTTLDPNGIAWSPDSTKVAFTENLTTLTESDLWVFDITSGILSDLTDDHLEGDISTSLQRGQSTTKDIYLDSLPAWSPDGKSIAFIRSIYGSTKKTIICLIPAGGGQVTEILIADGEHSLAVWRGMRWTPDGKKIIFTIDIIEDTTGKNGIWIVDVKSKNYSHLVNEKEGWGYPALYDISAKGDLALIGYPRALVRAAQFPNNSFYELLDLKTLTLTPLIQTQASGDQQNNQPEYYSPTQVTFSPDGSKILYHYNIPGNDQPIPQLVVRDINGTKEQVLENHAIYVGENVGASLFWAQNDTIYMMTGAGLGILYTLSK